jgi:glucose/arabinose dehydrogenase
MRISPKAANQNGGLGLRNSFGFAYSPQGKLYVTENAFDVRGHRRAWGAPEAVWTITPGARYGWPDYTAGQLLTEARIPRPAVPR